MSCLSHGRLYARLRPVHTNLIKVVFCSIGMFYPSPVFISRRRFLPSFCGVPGWVPPLTTGSPSTGRQTDTGLSPVTIISHHQGGLGADCLSSSALILTQLEIYRRADSHVSLTLLRLKQMSNLHIFKLFSIQKYERDSTRMII